MRNLKHRVVELLKSILALCFKLFYWRVDKAKPLPSVQSPLLLMSASQLAQKIRSKTVSCECVIETFIERIKQVNPLINCASVMCFDEALEEAKRVDEVLSWQNIPDAYNEISKPLLGVPFSCKGCIFVRNKPNSAGFVARRSTCASKDADVVKNMRDAGCILICLTNTSELNIWLETRNNLHGISKNPFNLSRIVGGSSGGEAGLISSCGSVIGIGTDTVGSIRMPAFFNGIYGIKVTPGLINSKEQTFPYAGGFYKEKLTCLGPLCRFACDIRILVKIQADKDAYAKVAQKFESKVNIFVVSTPLVDFAMPVADCDKLFSCAFIVHLKVDLKELNYYVLDYFGSPGLSDITESCSDALQQAVNSIESKLNVTVRKLKLNGLEKCTKIVATIARNGERRSLLYNDIIKSHLGQNETFNPFIEIIKSLFGNSKYTLYALILTLIEYIPIDDTQRYLHIRDQMSNDLNQILNENSVIIAPAFPCVAPFHHQPMLTNLFDPLYFGIWNALCLPAIQYPMGLCPKSGLPVGCQFVSNSNCDHLIISLAEYLEDNGVGGWKSNMP